MTKESFDITVVGIGAMGGGMARALMESQVSLKVTGYDRAAPLVDGFFEEAQAHNKAPSSKPVSLKGAVSPSTQFVLVVLQNEPQCQEICFSEGENLLSLLAPGSCVIVCSTVTATWVKQAQKRFHDKGILFVDSPVSGGPARARSGDLTLISSGDDASLERARPLLDALGKEVHIIPGGAGMGSTVKMVHQLLAGVHIVVAAEALALAAKAGLDVQQMYDIVNGAAGASWMFKDRGQRMLQESHAAEVRSQLQIFIKDLDIVYAEAKRLQSPVPLASAALQQFISGQSLGLGKKDDSQVVQVYERINGVKVGGRHGAVTKEGDDVGDYWRMADGSMEEILEVGSEPRHHILVSNEYVRALLVTFPPKDTTVAHRHAEDSLYFFLVQGGLNVLHHVKGAHPCDDSMDFGEVRYGKHKTDKPLVHKITNMTDKQMLCIDAEVLKQPPVTCKNPLVAEKHELIKTRNKCRVYKLTLGPGESVTASYSFFHFSVVLEPSTVEKEVGGGIRWTESKKLGDVAWKEPVMDLTRKNVGSSTFVEYIAEWC